MKISVLKNRTLHLPRVVTERSWEHWEGCLAFCCGTTISREEGIYSYITIHNTHFALLCSRYTIIRETYCQNRNFSQSLTFPHKPFLRNNRSFVIFNLAVGIQFEHNFYQIFVLLYRLFSFLFSLYISDNSIFGSINCCVNCPRYFCD